MLNHYLKTSIRSFKRNRTSFLINLIGLIGGLATVMFIYFWVNHELHVDKFHQYDDQLFRLINQNGGNETLLNTSPRFSRELESAIPEIELMVLSSWGMLKSNLDVNNELFPAVGEFATEDFFELFFYPLLSGDKQTLLDEPNSIVLSERIALKLFNSLDVIGKTLDWRWFRFTEPVVIKGVFKDLPPISSAQFDYVLSFDIFERLFNSQIERGNSNGRTFIKLSSYASVSDINEKIKTYTKAAYPESTLKPPKLIHYSDFYLHNKYEEGQAVRGRITLVRLFIAIGTLILIIACINFMNLSTARASLRTKEIGVRKVLGSQRRSLIFQYLIESCLTSLIAGSIAMILVFLLFEPFKNFIGLDLELIIGIQTTGILISIMVFTGLLAGSYPAIYLSGFKPVHILKGQFFIHPGNQWFRKGLVVFQFGISFILIVSVLVIYHQMKFIQTKDLGYAKNYILNFQTQGMNRENQQSFLHASRQLPGVIEASGITHALFGSQRSGSNITWENKDPNQRIWFEWGYVDYDMLELLEMDLVRGRFFSKEFGAERNKVVINETTWRLMEESDPIGKRFTIDSTNYEIIGVTKDFHFQSLHEAIKPTFFLLGSGWSMTLALKISPENANNTIQQIESQYQTYNPGFPFEYSFHDQDQYSAYAEEQTITSLANFAAVLALLISCLGLFGLASFITEQKKKELGIRKVLGANAIELITTLLKAFLLPVVTGAVLGAFVSYFVAESWLNEFAYRMQLQWWFYAVSMLFLLLFSLFTSTTQILKALLTNPIDSLKEE